MKILLKAGMVSGLALVATFSTAFLKDAQACGPEPYLGTICMTGANFCPRDYQPLNGQLLTINDFGALFAITGTTYGGNATTNFGVPDARGRELVHAGFGSGLEYISRGEYTGFELTNIPSIYFPEHSHDIDFTNAGITASIIASNDPADQHAPGGSLFANTTTTAANYSNTSDTYMAPGTVTATASTGSGTIPATGVTPDSQTALSALGPQQGLLFCVATEGLFPRRD